MSEITKGTWEVDDHYIEVYSQDPHTGLKTTIAEVDGKSEDEARANARLIASGPDLLQAALRVAALAEDEFVSGPLIREILLEAVAKALGRKPT